MKSVFIYMYPDFVCILCVRVKCTTGQLNCMSFSHPNMGKYARKTNQTNKN